MTAIYKYPSFIQRRNSKAFDAIYEAGIEVPYSGIYRCEVCGKCIVSEQGKKLPDQNHHPHKSAQGHIEWRLTVTCV